MKANTIIILAIIAVAAVGAYFFFFSKPAQPSVPKGTALNATDESNYQALLALVKQACPDDYNWFIIDVPLYFPGGARESWGARDFGSTISKTSRLMWATGELASKPGWQAVQAQAYQIYLNNKAQLVAGTIN